MTKTKTKIKNRIDELRLKRGWTHERLSRETYGFDGGGVTKETIVKVSKGAPCKPITKSKIARALGVTVEELFK